MNIKTLTVGKDVYNVGKNGKDKVSAVLRNWQHYSQECKEITPKETIDTARFLFQPEEIAKTADLPIVDLMVDTFSKQVSQGREMSMNRTINDIINGLPELKI